MFLALLLFELAMGGPLWAAPVGAPCLRAELTQLQNNPPLVTEAPSQAIEHTLLSTTLSDTDRPLAAYSEQSPALELGTSPRELSLKKPPAENPTLLSFLRAEGERQALALRRRLGKPAAEFEAWPTEADGKPQWVFARWREDAQDAWQWLEMPARSGDPILPHKLDFKKPGELDSIFKDRLELASLYDSPSFGDVVWTTENGTQTKGAWIPLSQRMRTQAALEAQPDLIKTLEARTLPQPARFNGEPVSFVISTRDKQVIWPKSIHWREPVTLPKTAARETPLGKINWPRSFQKSYQRDLQILSGERTAVFPISKKKMRFTQKSSADPDHQLEALVDYLEERYTVMGIAFERQRFSWRGQPQSNLIAKIKGSLPPELNRPIVVADHIDTAFAEDVFGATGKRVSVHGADDNVTAVATLLRAAETLKNSQPLHDIWLMHLTGEEFPADDLGARVWVDKLKKDRQDLGGIVLLDMIGYNKDGSGRFQINPGDSKRSVDIAVLAKRAAEVAAPTLFPQIHLRFDDKSYLYNTDGLIFDHQGYPVILINEKMNRHTLDRKGYHDTGDTVENVDVPYASDIAKTAILTARKLALTPAE